MDLDAEIREGSAGTGVFEKLVEDYFKSPHLSEQITKQLDSLLDDLYKPGDNGGVSLVTNQERSTAEVLV